jgi:hypothetical protein
LLIRREGNTIQGSHFIKCPALGPFHARAVITEDVNNQRVVGETHILNGFHDLPNGVVGIFLVARIHFHLVRTQFLYFR